MTTALILAGHGSHISPETAATVWRHVDRLRQWRVAGEIGAAFWKEAPAFHDALRLVRADDVTIVPVFTARGYFTQTVIPTELGLSGSITQREGRVIRYARTLGEHPLLTTLVRQRIDQWLAAWSAANPTLNAREMIAVAIIGHSTKLNAESRRVTEQQAEVLRAANVVAEVTAVYLDDTPAIVEAFRLTRAPILLALPYFIAEGSHVTLDIPRALGLATGQISAEVQGRQLHYLPPVGNAETALTEAILELACEVGGDFERSPVSLTDHAASWEGLPQAGADRLIRAVKEAGRLHFGQLTLSPEQVTGPAHRTATVIALNTPASLRSVVRGMTPATFRPLPTSDNLPAGWEVSLGGVNTVSLAGASAADRLVAVVETVYPGAMADWAAQQTGTLPVERLPDVIARQSGRLKLLTALSAEASADLMTTVCGHCVRDPLWSTVTPAVAEADQALPRVSIPCAAPCNWWLSKALATVERDENPKANEAE